MSFSIRTKLYEEVEKFLKDKNVTISDDKKSKFEGTIKSIESKLDKDLSGALNSARDEISDIKNDDGFEMSYKYADEILEKLRINLRG